MSANTILYSTSGCHLCELAAEILTSADYEFSAKDIAFDDDLYERYGERIPVVKRRDTQQELGWPFDTEQITEFLS